MKYCISFVLETYTFFQNIKLFLIKTIIFSIKQFNISIGYNLNFLSNNVNRLIHQKSELKCLSTLVRKSQIMEYYYRKLIRLMTLSSTGMTILKVNWFLSHGTTNSCGVMIVYSGSSKIKVNRIKNDNQGRILIVDADIDEETFALSNLYNANTETEQIKTMSSLSY